jgi:hypothetical protein
MGVGGPRHVPAAIPPARIVQEAGWAQGHSGRVRKISLQPELDPRTVQPVSIRYTDCAIPAHSWQSIN